MIVYVVPIPWDSYSALGAKAFSTPEKARNYCQEYNKREDTSATVGYIECQVDEVS